MDLSQVQELIEYVHSTFNKATPNAAKIEFYYSEFCELKANDDAVKYIKNRFRNFDSFPSNLAKAIRAAYYDWHQAQPVYYEQTQCQTCNSYGLLIGQEHDPDDGQLYSYVFRCPNCENWRSHCGEGTPVAQLGSGRYMYKQNGSPYNPQRKAA